MGLVNLEYVETQQNLADSFTKSLCVNKHERYIKLIELGE